MKDTRYFEVCNFDKLQHYKDRMPPWIKLYNDLLDDYDFACLQDASKLHLIMIWLLASRTSNVLPYDTDYVARRINASDPVDLEVLRRAGFIRLVDHDESPKPSNHGRYTNTDPHASTVLASCKQSASLETETETETEKDYSDPSDRDSRPQKTQSGFVVGEEAPVDSEPIPDHSPPPDVDNTTAGDSGIGVVSDHPGPDHRTSPAGEPTPGGEPGIEVPGHHRTPPDPDPVPPDPDPAPLAAQAGCEAMPDGPPALALTGPPACGPPAARAPGPSVWDVWLAMVGTSEANRSYLGRQIKTFGEASVAQAVATLACRQPRPAAPKQFLIGMLRESRPGLSEVID